MPRRGSVKARRRPRRVLRRRLVRRSPHGEAAPSVRFSGRRVRDPVVPVSSRPPIKQPDESVVSEHAARGARLDQLRGLALVACAAVCFSGMATLVKYETLHGLSSMEAIFWRSGVAFLLNGIALLVGVVVPREQRRAIVLQCVFGFTTIAFAFYAIAHMVLADASVLIFLSPVVTMFLGSLILSERIDGVTLVCALFSTVGIVCVLRPTMIFGEDVDEQGHSRRPPTLAVISALLAATTQAFLYISVRRLQQIHVLVVTHYFALFSATAALGSVCIFQSQMTWPSTWSLQLAAVGTGVLAFVGQVSLTRGFQLEHAGIAAVMRYLDVVGVFIWDSAFLGEPVNPWSIVGAGIVCGCAVACALRRADVLRLQAHEPQQTRALVTIERVRRHAC